MEPMGNTTEERIKPKIDRHNLIIWILCITVLWYILIFEIVGELLFLAHISPLRMLIDGVTYMHDAVYFAYSL